jgi:hypothetical protein
MKFLYQIRNLRHRSREVTQGRIRRANVGSTALNIESALGVKVIRANGKVEDKGIVGRRVVTTAGVNFIVDAFQNLTELENMKYHEMGTGSTAEATGDTALVTAVETRTAGTQTEASANQYVSVATITATATRAIQEHGIFSASSAGTLLDRTVFTTINLASGDSIQFTYTLTVTAGG